MSTGTFAPAPGAAPVARQVAAQAAMEARLLLRNGEQLLLAVVIPLIVLVGAVQAADRFGLDFDDPTVDVLTPGVLALAVMSTAFTSLAIATGFERRYGVLKRLGSAPSPAARCWPARSVRCSSSSSSSSRSSGPPGWPSAGPPSLSVPGILLAVLLGTAAFAGLGMLLAGTLRAEATLAAANLVYLLLLAGGAVVVPASAYGGLGEVVRWLPSGALGEAMRAASSGDVALVELVVLAAWAVLGGLATARWFKWE
ncbi:ABC transporter permease [Nocardioides sp. TF02-7]|uniref:ABC transporter permease n=1 Tax=Nocardioides sp. TF02-7 TaxID=2917724 RepID=UPI0031F5B691